MGCQACPKFSSQPKAGQTVCVNSNRPKCDKVFLGPDIGWASVMTYHDSDGSCHLSVKELAAVCKEHYQQCLAFLQSSNKPQKPQPKCDKVFLGPGIGWGNIMEYHDDDGTCHLSMKELAKVCQSHYKQCLSFLESSKKKPTCEKVYLGSDLGYQNIMEYHDADGTCHLSMKELLAVCKTHFQKCLSFLKSSEKKPKCDPVFLGPDIGYMNIFTYHDDDKSCHLSMKELSAACREYFAQCLAFLESSKKKYKCKAGSGKRTGYKIEKPQGTTVDDLGKVTCASGYKGKPEVHCMKAGGDFWFGGCTR